MGVSERREREKAQRRVDIIDAAERIFFEKGIETATMDEVAEAAELSKGTLYLYFKSKEDLYLAILVRGMEILKDMFEAAVAENELGVDKVGAIGRAYFQFGASHTDYFNAMLYFDSSEPPVEEEGYANVCDELSTRLFEIVAGAVQSGIEDGSIRSDADPVRTALTLYATSTGMLQITVLKGNKIREEFDVDPATVVENYFDLVDQSLRVK